MTREAAATPIVKYDLTNKISQYLDNHLVISLLQFLKGVKLYKKDDINKAILAAMSSTYLVEPALQVFKELSDKSGVAIDAASIHQKQDQCDEQLTSLGEACSDLLELVRNEGEIDTLISEGNFNAEYLSEAYGIKTDTVEAFLQYARVVFQNGLYDDSNLILFYYRALCPDQDKLLSCYWGKIAAQIMTMQTNEAVLNCWADFQMLQKLIDEKDEKAYTGGARHLEVLQLRSWLLHWSLFLFFKEDIVDEPEESRNAELEAPPAEEMPAFLVNTMVEFFSQEKHLNAIQINCPWLLRYFTAAIILKKPTRYTLRTLVKVISQEAYTYEDPLTKFIQALLIDFDFDAAQKSLVETAAVFRGDFFLKSSYQKFLSHARLLMFETYCRVHATIDIQWMSKQLNMTYEEAEHWVVNLITNARLDAKINSEKGCVEMGHKLGNPYQETIDMTKDLAFRSFQIVSNVSTQ